MDFLVSLVGRTLLNLKTFLDGTEMMEDSLYEGQMRYIPEEAKEDKNFVEKIVYVSPIRHAEGNFYLSQILAYPEMYEQMLQVLKEYDEGIISINYDDNERRIGKGTYKILSKSNKKALPLNVYGDGMKKAILLMSAVIAAKDGLDWKWEQLIRWACAQEMGVMTYGTLGGGILTGKYRELKEYGVDDNRNRFYPYFKEPLFSKVMLLLRTMDQISEERNVPLSQIALNWTLQRPFISSCIIGAQSRDKIEENCKAFEWKLSDDEMQLLEQALKKTII